MHRSTIATDPLSYPRPFGLLAGMTSQLEQFCVEKFSETSTYTQSCCALALYFSIVLNIVVAAARLYGKQSHKNRRRAA